MSSDSDDDCYGNIAQKLNSIKSKYSDDKIKTSNLLIDALKSKNDETWRKNDSIPDLNSSQNSAEGDEITLDEIIAKNSKKRTRASKRAAEVFVNNLDKSKKSKREESEASTSDAANQGTVTENNENVGGTKGVAKTRGRGRGKGRAKPNQPRRGRSRKQPTMEQWLGIAPQDTELLQAIENSLRDAIMSADNTIATDVTPNNSLLDVTNTPTATTPCHVCGSHTPGIPVNTASTDGNVTNVAANVTIPPADVTIPPANVTNPSTSIPNDVNLLEITTPVTNSRRGRGRARGRGRNRQTTPRRGGRRGYSTRSSNNDPDMYDYLRAIANSLQECSGSDLIAGTSNMNGSNLPASSRNTSSTAGNSYNGLPVYSVGNTDEYPDGCDNLPLFSNPQPKPNDVVILDNEAEPELENEEMSVKVYWQSSEHVKFCIRRFQKFTKIFDHFSERENVSKDKLFFTYNDKILKSDDTPDSVGYSFVKFIDGGIINQSVASLVKTTEMEDGLKLKFQCQNLRKPFVCTMRPDDKMHVVMVKCAEHLEKPLEKLKFSFDGDLISGKSTARELELEGGECIDVRIIS